MNAVPKGFIEVTFKKSDLNEAGKVVIPIEKFQKEIAYRDYKILFNGWTNIEETAAEITAKIRDSQEEELKK